MKSSNGLVRTHEKVCKVLYIEQVEQMMVFECHKFKDTLFLNNFQW